MNNMISVASGFQYSVNIGFDLNSDEKIKNFIPTRSAMNLLKDILLSTKEDSTERSRILIGAYGKGKSHIVLMILSMLLKRDLALFEKTMPKVKEDPDLLHYIENYYDSNNKILPVVITGSNTSLNQAFLLALQRTLSENDLLDVMPETNYKAAVSAIERWKNEFKDTYTKFESLIDVSVSDFIENLLDYDIASYEKFESIYPTLTAGSTFNPFLGFDVVELYESVAKSLKDKGYTGLYVVYDEFSKYLEANIAEASVSDTKMLQDFAEKCNRSGKTQLHLMLISHKEISNYIDKLPKQKVDGWRGVSERFKHIHLNNNFSQTYEIIASVIQKDKNKWNKFLKEHSGEFDALINTYKGHPLFSENSSEIDYAVYGCYPLHPVSTFILPRLSERVAQNERTLFTFLSSNGNSTLPFYLACNEENKFGLITPDIIYDYFEPLFKKELYSGDLHKTYVLTNIILKNLDEDSLESKIVKTLSLIYILGQFERLKPTKAEIVNVFSRSFSVDEINKSIDNLIEKEFVIYLKRSNDYLKLKQTSGVDIRQKINDYAESHARKISVKETLNTANFDNFMYPARYNDEREMTRYFSFIFIDENEVNNDTNWNIKCESINADGVIYAILPHSEDSISTIEESLLRTSVDCNRCIFVIPKHYKEIDRIAHEYEASVFLRESASEDEVLFEEYDVVYDDLKEVLNNFMSSYTHPEKHEANYIFNGEVRNIRRKASLTALMSDICDNAFALTPIINNEAVNKNDITSIAVNSRSKIVTALLRNELDENLGLLGSGQEVSIMRSTLLRTGVLENNNGSSSIVLRPDNELICNMLETIENFILTSRQHERLSFDVLYDALTLPENHIGLRKGLIPIYLAAVMHEYKQQIVVLDNLGQVPVNSDLLLQINAEPSSYYISYLDWNPEKEAFVKQLTNVFNEYVIDAEKANNTYDYIVLAMKRWLMDLPKYTKENTTYANGEKIDKRFITMLKLLKKNNSSYDLLFDKLPKAFGYNEDFPAGLSENIKAAKDCFDNHLNELKKYLISKTCEIFSLEENKDIQEKMSLTSTIRDWCDSLNDLVFDHIFADGTNKCLSLFKSITNDENTFIIRLAKSSTGLRIEDWDRSTIELFSNRLRQYRKTAEEYIAEEVKIEGETSSDYKVTFVDEEGKSTTKSFERVETSKRSKLLYNQITQSLEAMGHAITEQEKRQVLMDILKNLC